jgi:FAD/FMN-containing dehydrogenase
MDAHQSAVAAIAARIQQFHATKTPFRVYHGSTSGTRKSQRRRDNTVDTSSLNRVLNVDTAKMTVLVEPNVPMDALVDATLQHGLVPPVVMEFPGITVGGGFSGTSGESSSFRYGAFENTVNWIEIVLPNGDVARASKTEKPDLFWGAASSFGTLGVVTLLEVQLRDAKRYVELTYRHVKAFDDVVSVLQAESTHDTTNDYVDAITFSLDSTVICTGRLVDTLPQGVFPRQFLRARDPWFYLHAQDIEKRLQRHGTPSTAVEVDYIPLVDYLFRYDRGGFWGARYAFRYFITPFNRITRFLLNPFMHTRVMYRALHQSGLSDFQVVQDVGIPYPNATEFAHWLDQHLSIYPLWLCPLLVRREFPDSRHGLHAEFGDPSAPNMLNFGVWGPVSFNRRECVAANRALEQTVHRLGGKKWLYAHAYYTEDEFWAHYDRKSYDALRAKYGADYLPSVYDKAKVDVDAEEAAANASWLAWMLAAFWMIWYVRLALCLCPFLVALESRLALLARARPKYSRDALHKHQITDTVGQAFEGAVWGIPGCCWWRLLASAEEKCCGREDSRKPEGKVGRPWPGKVRGHVSLHPCLSASFSVVLVLCVLTDMTTLVSVSQVAITVFMPVVTGIPSPLSSAARVLRKQAAEYLRRLKRHSRALNGFISINPRHCSKTICHSSHFQIQFPVHPTINSPRSSTIKGLYIPYRPRRYQR